MKKLLLFLLVMSSVTAYSQLKTTDSTRAILNQARAMANPKSPKYKPQQAFEIYKQFGQKGNAEAMNGLGMMYSQGIGTKLNEPEGLTWFEKSAKKGYARAWFNLASMYKSGIGTDQDLIKAYEYFKRGADLNDRMSLYGQGYMLYKGLGCTQNYEQAAALFKRGANLKDEASYYMLGLCYRNGYGITANQDSATYYLKKAAAKKDKRAIEELAGNSPENINLKEVPNLQPPGSGKTAPVNLKSGFQQVAHKLSKNDLGGEYNGYVIKFDWSGKYIIGQAGLKLQLEQKDKILSGEWQEEGQEAFTLAGTFTDTAVVFNNTQFSQSDHYHKANPIGVSFVDAHFNLTKIKDTVYLSGTPRLYSPEKKEPEKPEFFMLIRTGAKTNLADFQQDSSKTDSLHFVAYPNPFINNLQLRYTLKKPAYVSIIVTSLLTNAPVYRHSVGNLLAGDHTTPVAFSGLPGNYIVTLQYGNRIKSAIVSKQ